jgi:alkylhydroperoxidase/carboxymuconolactone decarboxylase family protein YurZ
MSGGFEQAAMDRMIEDGEKFFSSYLTQADDVLFGEVWNGEAIDVKTKCIITVVSLMASGITDSSLTYHLQNAKAHGVTKEEIAAIITHATMYVGWPKGWAVFRLAKEVWTED